MKKYLFAAAFFSLLISCNDREKKPDNDQNNISETADYDRNQLEDSSNDDSGRENEAAVDFDQERGIANENTNPETNADPGVSKRTTNHNLEGKFRKIEEAENTAGSDCSVINVSFSGTSQLCVVPNSIYISIKYQKTGANSADIFLVDPVKTQNLEREIPWEDFDRNTPIATLNMKPNGQLELDWKGFSINGELAVDYAIYGKKALEGTYERE